MYLSIIILIQAILAQIYGNPERKPISEIVNLRAVTSFSTLEELYCGLHAKNRKKNPRVPSSRALTRTIKKELCRRILSSTFFDMKGEDLLDTDDMKNRKKIENFFRNSYGRVFEQASSFIDNILKRETPRKYVNDYFELRIRFADQSEVKENVFSCFSSDRDPQNPTIFQYFVSKEYDITAGMQDATPMAARFLFSYDSIDRRAHVIAIAEEEASKNSVHWLAMDDPELDYLSFRANSEPSSNPLEDPVCKLEHDYKLRLCSIIFASTIFTHRMVFLPLITNVQEHCEPKKVSFATKISQRKRTLLEQLQRRMTGDDKSCNERMFFCKVLNAAESRGEEFVYVSLNERAHTVFLYTPRRVDSEEVVFVTHNMKNVSVVDAIIDGGGTNADTVAAGGSPSGVANAT